MDDTNQSASQPLVLIVDDERNVRLMLGRAMSNEGYQVMEANTGEACLLMCQHQRPALILLDAIIPGMDGFTCCAQLQVEWGDRCPPILMITALADTESVDKAFAAGATDFVTKPLHWAVLRQRVQRILQADQALTELRAARKQIQALTEQLDQAKQALKAVV